MKLHPHMWIELAVTWGSVVVVLLAIGAYSLWRLFTNENKRRRLREYDEVVRLTDEVFQSWRKKPK